MKSVVVPVALAVRDGAVAAAVGVSACGRRAVQLCFEAGAAMKRAGTAVAVPVCTAFRETSTAVSAEVSLNTET